MMYSRPAIEPKIFDGPPPEAVTHDPLSGDYFWSCECGAHGVSASKKWAHSDVNRHRQRQHPDTNGDMGLHDNAINEWADDLFGKLKEE